MRDSNRRAKLAREKVRSESAPRRWGWVRFVFFWGGLMLFGVDCGWGQWSPPQQLHGRIDNDASVKSWPSINATEDTIYYAKLSGNGNENICFSYRYDGDQWSEPFFLPTMINTPQREISPCIGPEDSILYFVSYGRAGGYGSYDIWYTRRGLDGQWMEPENPGPNINSAGEEWGVFISRDGQHLYFSSDRPPQGSGLDILVSEWQGNGWGEAVVLPGEVNWWTQEENVTLPADESFLILTMGRWDSTHYDLWRCNRNGEAWGEPQWIHDVNYVRDENGSSISPDGLTLYLASERDDSFPGSAQLYVSQWTDAVDPVELGDLRARHVTLFPNPATGSMVTVIVNSTSLRKQPDIEVFNVLGQHILVPISARPVARNSHWEFVVDFAHVAKSKYFISVHSNQFAEIIPITVQ